MDLLIDYLKQVAHKEELVDLLIFYRFEWSPEELWAAVQMLHNRNSISNAILCRILTEWQTLENIPVRAQILVYLQETAPTLVADYNLIIRRSQKDRDLISLSPRLSMAISARSSRKIPDDSIISFPDRFAHRDFANFLSIQLRDICNAITLQDLASGGETKQAAIRFSERLAEHVIFEVLSTDTIQEAAQRIDYYLDVAKHLHQINNYEGLFLVIGALNHDLIVRLKQTIKLVNGQKRWVRYTQIMNCLKNYSCYRSAIEGLTDYIPVLGVLFKDLAALVELPIAEPSPWSPHSSMNMNNTSAAHAAMSSTSPDRSLSTSPSVPITTSHMSVHKIEILNRTIRPLLTVKNLYINRKRDELFERMTDQVPIYEYNTLRAHSVALEHHSRLVPLIQRNRTPSLGSLTDLDNSSTVSHLAACSSSNSSLLVSSPDSGMPTLSFDNTFGDYRGSSSVLSSEVLDCANHDPIKASKRDRGRWFMLLHKVALDKWTTFDLLLWGIKQRISEPVMTIIRANNIDGATIFGFNINSWHAAGLTESIHRRELCKHALRSRTEIDHYRRTGDYKTITKWDKYILAAWLEENEMSHLADRFIKDQVDGALLLCMVKDDFPKHGVTKMGDRIVINNLVKAARAAEFE